MADTILEDINWFIENNLIISALIFISIIILFSICFSLIRKFSKFPRIIMLLREFDSFKSRSIGRFKKELYNKETGKYLLFFKKRREIKEYTCEFPYVVLESLSFNPSDYFSRKIPATIDRNNEICVGLHGLEAQFLNSLKKRLSKNVLTLDANDLKLKDEQ